MAGRPVEDGGDTCRAAGTHMEYTTRGGFRGFGPQNTGGGSKEERRARGGIKEFASRRSYLMRGVVAARWKLCQVGLDAPVAS